MEKRSKYSVSFAMTRSFLAPRLLSFAKRETGGRTWVIAVPLVAIAPSRKGCFDKRLRLLGPKALGVGDLRAVLVRAAPPVHPSCQGGYEEGPDPV
ncbi:hypothetical protein ACWEOS_29200 [Micromonospora taraxaci]